MYTEWASRLPHVIAWRSVWPPGAPARRILPDGCLDLIWQDGAVFVQFPSANRWAAIFLKFQSQCWETDDRRGHCIGGVEAPPSVAPPRPAARFRARRGSRRRRE